MNETTFDEEIKMEDLENFLAHHGVPNMHWGVWNDETKRKYGVLGSKRKNKQEGTDSVSPDKPKNAAPEKSSLPKLAVEAVRQKRQAKRDAKAAEKQRIIDEENAKKQKEAEDAAFKAKHGMTKERYDALRQATLDSHDPRVVAKGMHLLTDEELSAKIQRLEQEGKIKSVAAKARKEEAEAKTAELNRKKNTLPYRLGEQAAKAVTNTVINNVTKNAVGPISSSLAKSLGDSGVKALESLKKRAPEAKQQVQETVKDTAATVKSEADGVKAERSAAKQKAVEVSQQKPATASKKKKGSQRNEVENGFGKELYERMKASNREGIDKDDPSLKLNYNNAKVPKGKDKEN